MFQHIAVPLDGSALAECVLPHVLRLAATFHARVTLIHVLEHGNANHTHLIDPLEWRLNQAQAGSYLAAIVERLLRAGVPAEQVVLEGHAAPRIIEFIHANDVDLVMLSSHGASGLSEWPISSVVQKLVTRSHCNVMIVQAYQPLASQEDHGGYRHILVPLDGSPRSACALPAAIPLAQAYNAELLLVHVVLKPEMPRQVPLSPMERQLMQQVVACNRQAADDYLKRLSAELSVPAQTRLLENGDIIEALTGLMRHEHIDLVVLSAHGYSGQAHWPYGKIALTLISQATVPMLIVQDLATEKLRMLPAELAAREHGGH